MAWLIANRSILLLGVILAIATVFRTYKLGEVPYGLNQDEVSTAYDAYAIGYFGIDRAGNSLPLFLESWGSGMQALPAYFLIPFYYFFGVSIMTMRLCAAFCGVMSVFFSYYIFSNFYSKFQGLLTGFFVAISPWHIMQSRWFFEAAFFPFIFLAAFALYVHALKRKSIPHLFFASAGFSLCLYTYAPAYFFIPLFFFCCSIFVLQQTTFERRTVAISLGIFVACCLPLGYYLLINSFNFPEINTIVSIPALQSAPRYETFTNNFSILRLSERFFGFFKLMFYQRDELPYNAMPKFGILYPFAWMFFLVGLGATCWSILLRKNWNSILIILWLTIALILVSIIDANLNRANIVVLLFLLIVTMGLGTVARLHIGVLYGILFIYSIFSYQFAVGYFGDYQWQTAPHFFHSFNNALSVLEDDGDQKFCITDTVKMPYIYTLFHFKIDPRLFIATVEFDNPGEEFQKVKSFDRFTFGLGNCDIESTDVFLLANEELESFQSAGMKIQLVDDYAIIRN